jgi:hypothetical protein
MMNRMMLTGGVGGFLLFYWGFLIVVGFLDDVDWWGGWVFIF